jgi:hypothetical protein
MGQADVEAQILGRDHAGAQFAGVQGDMDFGTNLMQRMDRRHL